MSSNQLRSAEIIPLFGSEDRPASNALHRVEHLWCSLRQGELVPAREQLHPGDLGLALPHVFILEQTGTGAARIRVSGSVITRLAGLETRGMPFTALMRPPARRVLLRAVETCLSEPAAIDAPFTARSLQAAPDLLGRMLLLPLRCGLGRVSRVLGAVTVHGAVASDAYRLDMASFVTRPVDEPCYDTGPRQMGQPPAHFTGPPRLRLVCSDQRG